MLKEQKNQVFVFGIVAILGILLAPPVAKAALNIEGIYMTSYKDHFDGIPPSNPWSFELWISLVDHGTLDHIDLTLPDGTTYPLNNDYFGGYYDSPLYYLSLADLQADYPPGTYTFDFRDSGGGLLNSVPLNYSALSEPGATVNFTYPSTNGQEGIDINPTLTWDPVSDGDALAMWLWDPVTGVYLYENDENDLVSISETSLVIPGSLQHNHNYDLGVSVINVMNLQPGPALPTMNVGGDAFEYCLMIEYVNEINFTTAGETPETMLAALAPFIMDEVDLGNIDPKLEGSLLVKVYAALSALEKDNPNAAKVAMNNLKALINHVEDQIDKKITPAAAAEIIQQANTIIAVLGG